MKSVYFKEQYDAAQRAQARLQTESNRITTARFLCFCAAIAAAAFGYDSQSALWYAGALLLVLTFFRLVQKHQTLRRRQRFNASRQTVLGKFLARFTGDWQRFEHTGEAYLKETYPQAKDLDLLGKHSLYQYLCCAHTAFGQRKLADALCESKPDPAKITARQEAVQELAAQKDFVLHFLTLGDSFEKSGKGKNAAQTEAFLQSLASGTCDASKWRRLFTRGLPILAFAGLLLACSGEISFAAPLFLFFLQLTIAGLFYNKHQRALAPLFQFYRLLSLYGRLFGALESASFQSAHLTLLQKTLSQGGGASRVIRRLHRIGECVDMRCNFIFYIVGNALFLWDFHCADAFSQWTRRHGNAIRDWFEAIAELELLLSLSTLCLCKEQYAFPTLCADAPPTMHAEAIFHPLLDEQKAVANSLCLHAQTLVITGSNMSGKTTFLRTVGISCALAFAGAPVCAARLELTPMRLFTSMRVEDDISKGISTFYAELLRIKTMVEYSARQLPMLALIDEIFKGTNSADRIIGAKAAVQKLSKPWCVTLVSTHDLELCSLDQAQPPAVNYHFAEFYQDDQIRFDYKIKPGPSQTTNAKYLLKMAGIS